MADQRRPVVAVHGVGAGENEDRAGFSDELAMRVERVTRPLTRVGMVAGGAVVPVAPPAEGILWEEALWESEHHEEDLVLKTSLGDIGVPVPILGELVGDLLDLLVDVPLYMSASGVGVRARVQSVIAAHPGCIVVGHSLGSVVAADVLSEAYFGPGAALDVAGLVTVGSPLNLLGLRVAMTGPFPFTWENHHYPDDPICFGSNGLDGDKFPGVENCPLNKDEGFGIAHQHYWSSTVIANSVYRMSRS